MTVHRVCLGKRFGLGYVLKPAVIQQAGRSSCDHHHLPHPQLLTLSPEMLLAELPTLQLYAILCYIESAAALYHCEDGLQVHAQHMLACGTNGKWVTEHVHECNVAAHALPPA